MNGFARASQASLRIISDNLANVENNAEAYWWTVSTNRESFLNSAKYTLEKIVAYSCISLSARERFHRISFSVMFQLDALIDTSVLPADVMSLRDEKFFDFVNEEVGIAAASLLAVQGINSVKSLLMTPNVHHLMDLNSKDLDGFKKKYGYLQDDGTFVLQPGVKGNVDYLIDLLRQKCVDDSKSSRSSKRNQSSSTEKVLNLSSGTFDPTTDLQFNTRSTTMPPVGPSPAFDAHRTYITDTVNNWCKTHQS